MKKQLYFLGTLGCLALTACEKHTHETSPDDPAKEYKFIRVLVSDETTGKLSLVTPFDGSITALEGKFPKGAVYTTESGRYAALVHRENNLTEFVDTGLEQHADHVDIKGTPKKGSLVGESALPTHFKSKRGEVLLFNDGDGTLSIGRESDIHTPNAKLRTVSAGLLKHHGAMATFSNGTYAITEKDNSITGSLPERVRIIDAQGKTLFASKLATRGIHGNATDGNYAVFGSASGILVVDKNGGQKLIAHPEGFGTAWFGSILETSQEGRFIGYTAAKGAYLIDVVAGTVKPIFENTDIMQCKTTITKDKLAILQHSGDLKLFTIATGRLEREAKVLDATEKTSTQKPQLEATNRMAYVTLPATGELLQARWDNLQTPARIKVSGKPYRLAVLGYESNIQH